LKQKIARKGKVPPKLSIAISDNLLDIHSSFFGMDFKKHLEPSFTKMLASSARTDSIVSHTFSEHSFVNW